MFPLGHYLHSISPYQGIVPSGTCTISIIIIPIIDITNGMLTSLRLALVINVSKMIENIITNRLSK